MLTDLTRSIKQMEFDFPKLRTLTNEGEIKGEVLKKTETCQKPERERNLKSW